jgi:hypothetical protein
MRSSRPAESEPFWLPGAINRWFDLQAPSAGWLSAGVSPLVARCDHTLALPWYDVQAVVPSAVEAAARESPIATVHSQALHFPFVLSLEVPMSDRWADRLLDQWPLLIVAMVGVGGAMWIGWQAMTGGLIPQTEPAGSPISMRGCDIIKLRVNNTRMPQELSICSDGGAARSDNPPDPHRWTHYHLSPEELHAVLLLRRQWCMQKPVFQTRNVNTRDYDLGMRCTESHDITQFRIPADELPAIFAQVEQKLPALPPTS